MNAILNLKILPLGSYDVLIGMDWLESHRVILNCLEKYFTCIDDKREACTMKGRPRHIYVRKIFEIQMKK